MATSLICIIRSTKVQTLGAIPGRVYRPRCVPSEHALLKRVLEKAQWLIKCRCNAVADAGIQKGGFKIVHFS